LGALHETRTYAEIRSATLAYIRKLSARVAVLGPIIGLFCGAALYVFAIHVGVPAPAWSGSVFIDWTLHGLLVSAILLAGIWWCVWIEWPEEPPTTR
jgi:hypothetical protein